MTAQSKEFLALSRETCRTAVETNDALLPILKSIYLSAFGDIPSVDDAETVMSQRVIAMYQEYRHQLQSYGKDRDGWLRAYLVDCKDGGQMVRGLGAMLAKTHAQNDAQLGRCQSALAQWADGQRSPEEQLEVLKRYAGYEPETLLANAYPAQRPLTDSQADRLACVYAMLMYARTKTSADPELAPQLSLDSVSILSFALVDALYRPSAPSTAPPDALPQIDDQQTVSGRHKLRGIALVAALMCCQYMFVKPWSIMGICLTSLMSLVYPFSRALAQMLGINSVSAARRLAYSAETSAAQRTDVKAAITEPLALGANAMESDEEAGYTQAADETIPLKNGR